MKEIKEKKLVQTEQTVYKYISDDGKFSSEFSYDVEKYEQKQQEPYIKEYKTRLSELHKWVTENKEYLYTGKDYAGTLDEMILYLLLRDNNAKDCYVEKYSSRDDGGWEIGDF